MALTLINHLVRSEKKCKMNTTDTVFIDCILKQ